MKKIVLIGIIAILILILCACEKPAKKIQEFLSDQQYVKDILLIKFDSDGIGLSDDQDVYKKVLSDKTAIVKIDATRASGRPLESYLLIHTIVDDNVVIENIDNLKGEYISGDAYRVDSIKFDEEKNAFSCQLSKSGDDEIAIVFDINEDGGSNILYWNEFSLNSSGDEITKEMFDKKNKEEFSKYTLVDLNSVLEMIKYEEEI